MHHAADLAPVTEVCNTVTVGLSLGECLSMTGIYSVAMSDGTELLFVDLVCGLFEEME